MAETMISIGESNRNPDGLSDHPNPSPSGSLFHRRIEFQLAKKPFTGFSNGSGDFRLETLNPSSEPQRTGSNQGGGGGRPSSLPGKKPDMSRFLENGLDPELSLGITFRRIGAGLENLGNTCFLNSVLQCLTYTEPLAAYLQSGKHQNSCRTAGFCALCAIQKHVSRALQSTGRILAPKDLVSNLRCISRNFRNSRQEDAHEYMVNLLESMHKCCLPSGVPSESPSAYERSLVHKIFGGRLRSQVKCMQCSFCSDKFDPFLDLSLEIVKADSLYKALAHFTAKEQLDGGERQYQCQRCKQKVKALKQLSVHKAPNVLTVHLKRFGSHAPGQKIDKRVHFGPTLDLKPFVTGPYDGDLKYTLYGVLVHAGWSTHSGHYYCFVRTSSGMWHSLDDNRVVQVSERTVLDQKAYMLFYVRDRRNFAPKKPVDVKKDNMGMHAVGNKTHTNPNQGLKEAIQNEGIDKKLNGAKSSANVCERDTKESASKPPSKVPLPKAPIEEFNEERSTKKELNDSVLVPSIGSGIQSSAIKEEQNDSVVGSANDGNTSLKKGPSGSVSVPPNCNGNTSTTKDLSELVSFPPNCNGPKESIGDMGIIEKTSPTIVNEASCHDPDGKAAEEKDSVSPLNRTSNGDGDCKIGGFSKAGGVGDSTIEKGVDVQSLRNSQPVELSSHTNTGISLRTKSPKKILKKKLTSMHFGPHILLGASLASWKKKKQKKSKNRNLKTKNLTRGHLLDNDRITTDLGPSTSEKTRTVSLADPSHSKRKKSKSGSEKKDNGNFSDNGTNSNGVSLLGNIGEDFRERVGQNGSVLATAELPQKCSDSAQKCSGDSRRESMQSSLMNMLTRGLEETIVARWDEIELPPPRTTDLSGVGNVSIGYVGDEWDEEYDRGKRKKVRNCLYEFGGPNPFQEIASNKAKQKKAKMDHLSLGNGPLRI